MGGQAIKILILEKAGGTQRSCGLMVGVIGLCATWSRWSVKVGDLVAMPGATLAEGEQQPTALVVEPPSKQKIPRVGVLWSDGEGIVDWEPAAWLEVLKEKELTNE